MANRNVLEDPMTEREHEQLLAAATDRFERRLSEETGKVRMEIAEVRIAVVEGDARTRVDMAEMRGDMTRQFASARIESEVRHRQLLKWAFAFWLGQAAVTAGIVRAILA